MRILAQVISANNIPPEPAATQALAYILNVSTSLAQDFLGVFRTAGVEVELKKIVAEKALNELEDGIPDLTVYDASGTRRLLVENKFWAGLEDTQPVSYLNALPEEGSALLFIVPSKRVSVVWQELKARCSEANMMLGDDSPENGTTWVRVDARTLLITSWDHVLAKLLLKAKADGFEEIEQDIIQLHDLAKQMDSEALLPLRADEVTDQSIPRRLENYVDLALAIVNTVSSQTKADQLTVGTTDHEIGRYIRYGASFKLWFGISIPVWRKRGISPLWCYIPKDSLADVDLVKSPLETRLKLPHDFIYDTTNGLYIPVQLKLGADKDAVIDDAASKIRAIVNVLLPHRLQ